MQGAAALVRCTSEQLPCRLTSTCSAISCIVGARADQPEICPIPPSIQRKWRFRLSLQGLVSTNTISCPCVYSCGSKC